MKNMKVLYWMTWTLESYVHRKDLTTLLFPFLSFFFFVKSTYVNLCVTPWTKWLRTEFRFSNNFDFRNTSKLQSTHTVVVPSAEIGRKYMYLYFYKKTLELVLKVKKKYFTKYFQVSFHEMSLSWNKCIFSWNYHWSYIRYCFVSSGTSASSLLSYILWHLYIYKTKIKSLNSFRKNRWNAYTSKREDHWK